MKGKKCFGLLFLLAIIFGLSLSVSSDVSALKYAYSSIPLYLDIYTNYPDNNGSDGWYLPMGSRFGLTFDASSGSHSLGDEYNSDFDRFYLCNDMTSQLANNHLFQTYHVSSRSQWSILSNQTFHIASYNAFNICPNYLPSALASRWDYDKIFLSKYNLVTGDSIQLLDVPNAFFDSGEDFKNSGSLKSLTIPLYLDYDKFDKILAGTQLEWDFGVVQKSANNFSNLSNSIFTNLRLDYFTSDPSSSFSLDTKVTVNISCSVDYNYRFQTRSNELWEDFLGFNVHCSWTPSSDVYYLHPVIAIAGDNSVNPVKFLDYDYHGLYFTGTYFITDGDDTWSGELADTMPTGEHLNFAPGFIQFYGSGGGVSSCSQGDFGCQLENLFNFSFTNPFAPIFQMFEDQSSCVSIPTIAGLIHSEETTVCPWFPSSVRQIATPILGISSVMLIFGFAVRWLGSSSGNLFEDSRHEEVSNQGGRWGHFKKGGF